MLCLIDCISSSYATYTYILPTIIEVPRIFFSGGFHQIQLRTEGRENGDLGAVAPESGVPLNLKMSEPRILIRLLRMYFPRNWEFGSALSKLQDFGRGLSTPTPPRYATACHNLNISYSVTKMQKSVGCPVKTIPTL
jgi:hypothetical protein